MPARSRQSAGQSAESTKIYDIAGFDFNEPLSWRPGKAIPVADLLSRLQALSNALRGYEEDQFDPQIFAPLATDLANPNLLGHKDKGVRAWALSCVVDLLKICAPDAPFSGTGLKDIFTVFINSVLPALADPNNAYNSQHVYILQSLSESQSIVLLADVPEPDNLITAFFTHAFDIFANSGSATSDIEVSKSVEYHLKNLLCTVVEESDLPQDVTDIILSQFLRVDMRKPQDQPAKSKKQQTHDKNQSSLLLKDYPPAYNLAKAICTTCQEKMTSQISQYFNAILVDAANLSKSHGHIATSNKKRLSFHESSDDEMEDLADIRKAHRLLLELWRACPDVLINVIPQVETELSADSIYLRQLATETLGDIAAGIGIAGLAPSVGMDPAAYPLPSIEQSEPEATTTNVLLTPASPKPFAAVHRTAYENFMTRRNDKSNNVRATWATAVARILFTAAGGIGFGDAELSELLAGYSQMLRDQEENVRIASIKGLDAFTYHGIINVMGADGGLSKSGTVFSTLAERFVDRKHTVRVEAISFASRLWGTASRDLQEGVETVFTVLGEMPTRLLSSYYTNDPSIHTLLDKVMYENIFPLAFPPVKASTSQTSSQRRRTRDAEGNPQESNTPDADAIRACRILTFLQALDTRSKQVFFAMQNRRVQMSKGMSVFLKACEEYNGSVVLDNLDVDKVKTQLKAFIDGLSKPFPDATKMSTDLWKFADLHNRRDYQLIRFAMSPESDYRTMQKAIKELNKRLREGSNTQALIDSIMQLVYRCSLIIYNRSHVPAIMEVSRTDAHGLAGVAHEILKEISARNPEVLKTHIQALCKELEESSPTATKPEDPSAGDTLKACAHFARKYPGEVNKDRKFLTALTSFALHSRSPRAAKHAVSVILTVAERKEMYAKDILSKSLKDAKPTSPNFLGQLAAIGQVCLLSSSAASGETEAILKLAFTDTLQNNRSTGSADISWEDPPSDETVAKELALKIMVNRCRSDDDLESAEEFDTTANAVIEVLMRLVTEDGEITSKQGTPPAQRNHLRLAASRFILKLCSHKRRCDDLLTAAMFNSVALVVINPPNQVRTGFVNQLKKYLGLSRLSYRWLTILFLLAFEPDLELQSSTMKWLRSRNQHFERQQQQAKAADKKTHSNVMESVFARLLSLMAHHPDYPDKTAESFDFELLDFSKYIVFYLAAVATEQNLSLIFHIAQRIKQTRDNITGDDEISERLYVLSDLSQAVIRNYADMMPTQSKGANLLQTWPGQTTLPKSLFKGLPSHGASQAIAEKNYLPEDTALGLERLIRDYVKLVKGNKQTVKRATQGEKKRKTTVTDFVDDEDEEKGRASKKKRSTLPIRKTPKSQRKSSPVLSSAQPSRKSNRVSTTGVSYAEGDSEEDDDEMEVVNQPQSSPSAAKTSRRAVRRPSKLAQPEADAEDENEADEDVEMTNGAAQSGVDRDVVVHEDEDAGEEAESEREPTPSPLKEKENTPAAARKAKAKAKTKATPSKKTAAKEQPQPTRATRQTRSTRV